MLVGMGQGKSSGSGSGDLPPGPHVAAVVFNSVTHDTRVLKQAAALAAAGFRVTILGVKDKGKPYASEFLENGVKIVRMSLVPQTHLGRALGGLAKVAALIALIIPLESFLGSLEGTNLAILIIAPFLAGTIFLQGRKRLLAATALLYFICYLVWLLPTPEVMAMALVVLKVYPGVILSIMIVVVLVKVTIKFRDVLSAPGLDEVGKKLSKLRYLKSLLLVFQQCFSTGLRTITVLAYLRKLRANIVHCHDLPTLPAGILYGRSHGIPVVYDSHEIFDEQSSLQEFPLLMMFFRFMQRICSRFVSGFITINDSIGEYLTASYPCLPAPVIVKNAAIWDGTEVRYDGRLHEAAGLAEEDRILLYQGGFAPHRGLEALVLAAPILPNGWFIVLMGWGKLEAQLRMLNEARGDSKARVRFLPGVPQQELRVWTAGATVGVIPYPNTGLNHEFCTPNKLWEYPSADVPILASPLTEMRKIITKYEIGWLLPTVYPEPEEIAEALARLGDSEIAVAKMACRRFMQQDNWALAAEQLVGTYRRLVPQVDGVAPHVVR